MHWQDHLQQWTAEGLLEPAVGDRIRAYEAQREQTQGLRWPVLLAIALGGVLLGAGVLLFVAAHWDALSPSIRFALVLALVAVFHIGGAAARRFSALSVTLHAVGTVCLGAGIFLTGQIFNLQEHWPAGLMLWAFGAWIAWGLLRDWPQAALAALLTPAWLAGEWIEATRDQSGSGKILFEGLLLLSISYLTAPTRASKTPARRALSWIGRLSVIVLAAAVPSVTPFWHIAALPLDYRLWGWSAAFALPLILAWLLRGRTAWANVIAALWVLALGMTSKSYGSQENLGVYAMWALGGLGLIAWGLLEKEKDRINLGVAGFALTVLAFYFSNVMDKLGRSVSLIGLGLLFLFGGWLLEKLRRRLVAELERTSS